MPPMGVADDLLREAEPISSERFRFWLLTHRSAEGAKLWRTVVLRECVPEPGGPEDLEFEICGPFLR